MAGLRPSTASSAASVRWKIATDWSDLGHLECARFGERVGIDLMGPLQELGDESLTSCCSRAFPPHR